MLYSNRLLLLPAPSLVIPLLTGEAVMSEMLGRAILVVNEAARRQGGRPRLLPVFLARDGALRGPLADTLASLPLFYWESPEDNRRLAEEILHALQDLQASS
jgi:hypothetical protein